jgi:hypothetical protein
MISSSHPRRAPTCKPMRLLTWSGPRVAVMHANAPADVERSHVVNCGVEQTLLAAMLSSQTKDEVNERAMARLRDACGNTLDGLMDLGEAAIADTIKPVSFYTVKVRWVVGGEKRCPGLTSRWCFCLLPRPRTSCPCARS